MIYKILCALNLIAIIPIYVLVILNIFDMDDLKRNIAGVESTCYLIARA